MATPTLLPHYFVLYWEAQPGGFGCAVLGVFSSLEKAQTEGQRYHKKTALEWKACTSDSSKGQVDYWFAPMPNWKLPTHMCIQRARLDSKAFRP